MVQSYIQGMSNREGVWEMEKQDESRGAFEIFSEFDDEENL